MKTFHFIITNADGDKKYITSILFKVNIAEIYDLGLKRIIIIGIIFV